MNDAADTDKSKGQNGQESPTRSKENTAKGMVSPTDRQAKHSIQIKSILRPRKNAQSESSN